MMLGGFFSFVTFLHLPMTPVEAFLHYFSFWCTKQREAYQSLFYISDMVIYDVFADTLFRDLSIFFKIFCVCFFSFYFILLFDKL